MGMRAPFSATIPSLGKITFGFALFYLLIDLFSYQNIEYAAYGLFVLGLVFLAINLRFGIAYYIVVLILSDDFSRLGVPHSSIYTVIPGPLSLSVYWTLAVLGGVLAVAAARPRDGKALRMDLCVLGLVGLYFVAAIIGLPNAIAYPRIFVQDLSYIVNLVCGYAAVRVAFSERHHSLQLVGILLSALGAKAIVSLAYYGVGIGIPAGANLRVLFDSSRVALGLLALVSVALLAHGEASRRRSTVVLLLFLFSALFNMLSFASRGNIILLSFGLLILLVNRPHRTVVHPQAMLRSFATVAGLVTISLVAMQTLRPGSLEYATWKATSIVEVNSRGIPTSTGSRILETVNISGHLIRSGNALWGKGLGGSFVDDVIPYRHLLVDRSAYTYESISTGQLHRPHGTHLVILLKMGFGGLIAYYALLSLFAGMALRRLRRLTDPLIFALGTGMLGSLPFFLFKNFTSQLQVLMGVVLALITVLVSNPVPGSRSSKSQES